MVKKRNSARNEKSKLSNAKYKLQIILTNNHRPPVLEFVSEEDRENAILQYMKNGHVKSYKKFK